MHTKQLCMTSYFQAREAWNKKRGLVVAAADDLRVDFVGELLRSGFDEPDVAVGQVDVSAPLLVRIELQ